MIAFVPIPSSPNSLNPAESTSPRSLRNNEWFSPAAVITIFLSYKDLILSGLEIVKTFFPIPN